MGTRTGVALAATGAVVAFVAHGLLQLAGIALILAVAAGLWLRRRPGWTRHRAEAIGSWLTAPENEPAEAERVPLEDIFEASGDGLSTPPPATPSDR